MKALITRTKNDTFYVYLTEKMLSKQDCLTIGKYTNSHKKRILPVFEYGCFLDDDYEYPIAVVERSCKDAAFKVAMKCKKIIEAFP